MTDYLFKSANEWTSDGPKAYNIGIAFQDSQIFFGQITLPLPFVDSEIPTADDIIDVASYTFRSQLELAMIHEEGNSGVVDFAVVLLPLPWICLRMWLPFLTCGEFKHAKVDVCVINCDANAIVRLDTCPQLVAGAIAAFQDMNSGRRAAGLEVLDSMVFLGIIMVRTSPSVLKIPVTHELAQCVETGTFPDNLTIVTGHVLDIPRPHCRFSEGMDPLDNRRVILRCYEAFKEFLL
ncbi:hypothetical protein EDC04DRAFT_2698494 [Pisolithus marmoratus]|nr:hypothetical protein EDC04DRAFT_2698494 [Pisolithus marmoratus]